MLATKLSKLIVTPSRIASILDWKKFGGTILSLEIDSERIGVALSEHPCRSSTIHQLEPISIARHVDSKNRLVVNKTIVTGLEELVRKHNVSAFIVGWPLQPEGRMGAPCAKVLHTLDSLADRSNQIVTKHRPIAFLDDRDIPREQVDCCPLKKDEPPLDAWGRSPLFSHAPDYAEGMEHRSSDQFLHPTSEDSSVAANLLKKFMEDNWELDEMRRIVSATKDSKGDRDELENEYGSNPISIATPARKTTKAYSCFTDTDEGNSVYIQATLL